MDILDTSKNTSFDVNAGLVTKVTCGVKCLMTYTASVEFKTLVDDHFSGNEQRRDQWTNPRRSWILEFEKTPANAKIMIDFFIRQKGKKRTFYWKWDSVVDGLNTGGNDVTYKVRFDTDKLDLTYMEMGYNTFKVPIIQVMDGA